MDARAGGGSANGGQTVERDLWNGADVRWVGAATELDGVRLRPSDRAVVVHAGRHHVTSFGSLQGSARTPIARRARGVTIRLVGGAKVTVPRRDLAIVPPEHPLAPEPDGTHASWWLEQLQPWGQHGVLIDSLAPSNLPAVCQVLHPWWGTGPEPIRWSQLARQHGFASVRELDETRDESTIPAAANAGVQARTGELDELTGVALVDVLPGHTTTPDNVFVAVWMGWGDVPPQRFPGAAHLETPHRGHFLLRGPLTGVLTSVCASGIDRPVAGLWWPADRAWFVATEIDFEWTFVAGSDELVQRLLADDRLEVARTSFVAPANRAADPRL
jgi:hypothetical protein